MTSKDYFFRILVCGFLIFLPSLAAGQVFRTIATANGNSVRYIQIYEYNSVDVPPSFPGGNMALMNFINQERRYPAEAYQNGVQGRVVCGFVVNEDGHISDITVMKSVEESLDREAMRVVSMMPRWMAGIYDNNPVPVFCIVTIPFRH